VGVEPAGNAGQQGGDQEDHDLGARRVDAHRLGHHRAALERADRAALARIEQVAGWPDGEQHEGPDQVVELAAWTSVPAEQRDRRNAGDAGVAAEELDIAEQEIEADAPGDGAQRQVVPAHAQRDEAEEERDRGGDGEADEQGEPRRKAMDVVVSQAVV
jgi:TATA-binding protein-associated factor Taf7